MDPSFDTGAACRDAVALRGTDRKGELEDLRQRIAVAHDTQMQSFTRLRLLSTAEVVAAARELHEVRHDGVDLSFGNANGDQELEGKSDCSWRAARWSQRHARRFDCVTRAAPPRPSSRCHRDPALAPREIDQHAPVHQAGSPPARHCTGPAANLRVRLWSRHR